MKLSDITQNQGKFMMETYNLHKYMKIDLAAINALSLFSRKTTFGF